MYFKQFYLGCLAHASYLIGSEGEAAVVDPQRDVDEYINEAAAQGFKIRYIIETHLHADFVSGHLELSERTGAEIVISRTADATFKHRAVKDGEELKLGKIILRIMETPGHTPESICVLVTDTEVSNQPQKILTGDTLFIGDVGRPDLAGGKGYTSQMMAGMMYDTLHEKLLQLADDVEVYPAHGAGSMCGKNMSQERSSTIGEQRKFNYALKPMAKDEFVRMMTVDLPEAPAYFPQDAEINRTGAEVLSQLIKPEPLSAEQVQTLTPQSNSLLLGGSQTENLPYVILDVRTAGEFGVGHVPGSLNIGLGGQFAMWAGTLIPLTAPIVIVADSESQVSEAQTRLARVGIENVKGYLAGGIEEWVRSGFEIATVPQISVDELSNLVSEKPSLQILDVRRPPEYASGHVPRALHAPLATLSQTLDNLPLDPDKQTAVICAGGYRSSAASSILQQNGFADLLNITGGTTAWINAGLPTER
jgi:glyoxylase-like metal-dependent hydrolase (beta-lactamase superfamily II)/rhodanese-related sulfurtransferase